MKKRHIHFVPDLLFVCTLGVLAILLLLAAVLHNVWLLLAAVPLEAWLVFRVFSRNLAARAKENQVFCRILFAPVRFVRRIFRKLFPDRRHVRVHCPACGAQLRLVNQSGDFTVTCPKCGAKFPIHIR